MKPPHLRQLIVQKITEELATMSGNSMPSLAALASRYGVSSRTVSAAAHQLAQRGLLNIVQGRTMKCNLSQAASPVLLNAPPSAAAVLEMLITDRIEKGEYQCGQSLPKVLFFAHEHHVSNKTVVEVFRILARKGLLHKAGKRWIVGPADQHSRQSSVKSSPVILLLMAKDDAWRWIYAAERTQRFCASFVQESERFDIDLVPVLTDKRFDSGDISCVGRSRIVDLIRQLDQRFRGILIVGSTGDIPDLADWICDPVFQRYPIVWFDAHDENLEPMRSATFTRCHFSEKNAIDAAVNHLALHGHCVAGYPFALSETWIHKRFQMIQESAQRQNVDLKIVGIAPLPEHAPVRIPQSLSLLREIIYKEGNPDESANKTLSIIRQGLVSSSRHLLPLLAHTPPISAIIACNDYRAVRYYRWLKAAGISVPGSISLLSFDNSIRLSPLPITSVDFGFGTLGYCAFHLIMRDIPIKCDSKGNLAAKARVIDRGSAGPTRQQSF